MMISAFSTVMKFIWIARIRAHVRETVQFRDQTFCTLKKAKTRVTQNVDLYLQMAVTTVNQSSVSAPTPRKVRI